MYINVINMNIIAVKDLYRHLLLLTSARISNDPNSSLRIFTSSSAVHFDDSSVKPTMSANRMLRDLARCYVMVRDITRCYEMVRDVMR